MALSTMELPDPIRVDREWLFPDGTRLPVVEGGSDDFGAAAPAAPEPAAPEGPARGDDGRFTATATDDGTPPAEPPVETPPWEGKTPEELWGLNEKLRGENIRYVERFRPIEQTLGGLHPDDQSFFLSFMDAIRTENRVELARLAGPMRGLLDKLTPAQQAAVADAAEAAQEEWDTLDPKQVEQRIDQRAAKLVDERFQALEQERVQRESEASAMRDVVRWQSEIAAEFKVDDFKDPQSVLGQQLLTRTNIAIGGNRQADVGATMRACAKEIVDTLSARGQELLKAKVANADPVPAPPNGEPSGQRQPGDMRSARKSAEERVDAILSGRVGS